VDAVVVCTPNKYHAPITIAALEAGKHVLCEKPMATSLADANRMIATAERVGRKLMIGHNQRLMAAHVKAKQILDSGILGRVLTFRTAFGHPGPEMWSQDKGPHTWFFKKDMAYVGSMGDLGVHKTDLIRWLLGEEVKEVGAFVETLDKVDETGTPITVDDNAVCILRMESGAVGQLAASWTYKRGEDNSTRLYCEKGMMLLGEDPDYPVEVRLTSGETAMYQVGAMATNEVQVESGIPRMFVNALLEDKAPEIGGEEGLRALAIVVACLESQQTGRICPVVYE
jgi:predicted dehydrogenase